MAVLALKTSSLPQCGERAAPRGFAGDVAGSCGRKLPVEEVPITSVTNGVHAPSWINGDLAALYDQYLQPDWRERLEDRKDVGAGARDSEPGTVGNASQAQAPHRGVRARAGGGRGGAAQSFRSGELRRLQEVLDPDVFTIGFARRFATYKRATLLFRDVDRLKRILNNPKMPVQIVIAGKAHPKDQPGKTLIREIVAALARSGDLEAPRSSSKTTAFRWRARWCKASICG